METSERKFAKKAKKKGRKANIWKTAMGMRYFYVRLNCIAEAGDNASGIINDILREKRQTTF